MKIVFMPEQGTLKMTDDRGQSIHKRGDDKIMCPNRATADVVVEAVSQLTGSMFFCEEKDGFVRWDGIGA
jgi:hypothetical protein